MKEVYGHDMNVLKNFGPRVLGGIVVPGQSKVTNGRDVLFKDHHIIRHLVLNKYDVSKVIKDLY